MPIYEYRCETCEETFEVRRPVGEAAASPACPQGHTKVRRVYSVFATIGRSPAESAAFAPCSDDCASATAANY